MGIQTFIFTPKLLKTLYTDLKDQFPHKVVGKIDEDGQILLEDPDEDDMGEDDFYVDARDYLLANYSAKTIEKYKMTEEYEGSDFYDLIN